MGEDRTEIGKVETEGNGSCTEDNSDAVRPVRITIRRLLFAIGVVGLLFSIEPLRTGCIVSTAILLLLMVLQAPLYLLVGAFRLRDK